FSGFATLVAASQSASQSMGGSVFLVPRAISSGSKDTRIRIENPRTDDATSGMVVFSIFGRAGRTSSFQSTLDGLRVQERNLAERYTDEHPMLRHVRKQIREVETAIANGINDSAAPAEIRSSIPIAIGSTQTVMLSHLLGSATNSQNFDGYIFIQPDFDGARISADIMNENQVESTTQVLAVAPRTLASRTPQAIQRPY